MDLLKNLNKKSIVGISVTQEVGLEIAEIDYETKTVLKYASRPLEYNVMQKDIADMDIFKEQLQDMLIELQIPKGTKIVLNLPTILFSVNDYPAALDDKQLDGVVEDTIMENPFFQNNEPGFSRAILRNSTIQSNKVAYTAVQKIRFLKFT